MVSKKFLFGLLAMTLIFGMMAIGCVEEDTDIEKKIAINGIDGNYNSKDSQIMVGKTLSDIDAGAMAIISGGSVTFELQGNSGRYTGDGQHYIIFTIFDTQAGSTFAYAPGVSTINSEADLKTYNITEEKTSFSFSDFKSANSIVSSIQIPNFLLQR